MSRQSSYAVLAAAVVLVVSGATVAHADVQSSSYTAAPAGVMSRGEVRAEHGTIVLTGAESWADQDIEFRSTFTVLPDGTIRDVYERFEGDDFAPGHVIEYALHPE